MAHLSVPVSLINLPIPNIVQDVQDVQVPVNSSQDKYKDKDKVSEKVSDKVFQLQDFPSLVELIRELQKTIISLQKMIEDQNLRIASYEQEPMSKNQPSEQNHPEKESREKHKETVKFWK